MSADLLTFEKFNDPELAATIAAQLKAQGVNAVIENEGPGFDVTFANNSFEPNIHLKLDPADFNKARSALEQYYQGQLADMDPGYYLFSFSDAELLDLVKNPDEWGPLDYALAKQILAEHGNPISPEEEAAFQQERIKALTKPEKSQLLWIVLGYIAAFLFPLLGVILGYILAYTKKTLPNGEQVNVYSSNEVRHGKRILILSAICFAFWLFAYLFLNGLVNSFF